MIRCCLCRYRGERGDFEAAGYLPGNGWRCIDRTACAERVRSIVAANVALGEVCE